VAELELLLDLNVWDYVKLSLKNHERSEHPHRKGKHIRRYKYTIEQNRKPIEGALKGLQESMVAFVDVYGQIARP
jgi:hypothetical protein